jgi:hypothetical protein
VSSLRPITPEAHLPLSALLVTLAEGAGTGITVGAIVAHFGPRAFGAVLFVFAMPNLLPLPPGSSAMLGLPLLLIAPQLAIGGRKPWIPARMARQVVDRKMIDRASSRAAPWVERVERLTTRRLGFMFGPLGDVMIGIVCTLLAAVLILPIPLGNVLPAAAIAALALSLTQRDGLLTIAGYLLAFVSAGVLIASGELVVAAVHRLGSMIGIW